MHVFESSSMCTNHQGSGMRPKRCVHEQGEQRTDFNRAHERPSKVWVGAMAPRVALVRLAVLCGGGGLVAIGKHIPAPYTIRVIDLCQSLDAAGDVWVPSLVCTDHSFAVYHEPPKLSDSQRMRKKVEFGPTQSTRTAAPRASALAVLGVVPTYTLESSLSPCGNRCPF